VHETTTFLLVTLPNIRAALGTEFLSLYPPHTHGDPIPTAEFRAAVGTEFLSPHPPHTHTYTHGDPHGDSHTHGRPAKYSPMLLQLLLFKDVVVRFPVGIAMREANAIACRRQCSSSRLTNYFSATSSLPQQLHYWNYRLIANIASLFINSCMLCSQSAAQ